jgi:c-di-GMP-binding flagellar brake protein YcgR
LIFDAGGDYTELSELEIGLKLELEIFDDDGHRLEPILVSKFEGSNDNNGILIAAPILEGNIYPLRVGSIMNVYFLKNAGHEINLFKFRAVVKRRDIYNNLHFIIIEQTEKIERIQRRQYFRLDCTLQVKYKTEDQGINDTASNTVSGTAYEETVANNLSGGGISLKLKEIIEKGKLLNCKLFLGNYHVVNFTGRVVRCSNSKIQSKYKFEAGLAFEKISDKDRETVVRYIFEEQRKLRKKGLI